MSLFIPVPSAMAIKGKSGITGKILVPPASCLFSFSITTAGIQTNHATVQMMLRIMVSVFIYSFVEPDGLWVVGGVTIHTASFRHASFLSSDKTKFLFILLV